MSVETNWSPNFCLACDKQIDGRVYCSEACRLTEYELSSSKAGSCQASPSSAGAAMWTPRTRSSTGFTLEPAYDVSNPQPYGITPSPYTSSIHKTFASQAPSIILPTRPVLTPSSSQCNLLSLRSSGSTVEPSQLSNDKRKALRAYANAFDQSRYSRRQSA